METSGIIVEKFIKFLTDADLMSEEMMLPEKILSKYVNVKSGGLKFIKFLKEEETMFDEFEHPRSFKKAFHLLPGYEEPGVTTISFFDYDFVEYIFPGTPLSSGLNSHALPVFGRIEIIVQPHHLYKYVYGVDISTDYIAITGLWKKKDYISIYSEEKGWKLQVGNRGGKSNRTTIHDGWIQFRDDLGLHLGDVVVLKCARNSIQHFALQVLRNHVDKMKKYCSAIMCLRYVEVVIFEIVSNGSEFCENVAYYCRTFVKLSNIELA
ncbi:hypothetical protein DCAR_0520333 [Daucus carota subsp. sativus]|uniref:Uncharacterized protein n=1 Tax=Daucus carota subsp. sativus TaxID=79200 RepID=A0A164YGW8_DAUCS|nr:hypothetical protein DCAR_0520333 [Daucus carota subsp. sativus]